MKADVLVCAPATAEMAARGSVFDRSCSKCGERVMVAPSGQRMLKEIPGLPIICMRCYYVAVRGRECVNIWAAPMEEIERERRDAIPNMHRRRN